MWMTVPSGHQLSIVDGAIVARNAAGRTLKSVPSAAKKTVEYAELDQLLDWLAQHERACAAQVDGWLTRGLPVPLALITQVWDDSAWRSPLTDLLVVVGDRIGLLRGVDAAADTVGLVTLDGETEWVNGQTLTIPHPVLVGHDLAEWREFALELGVSQALPQLMREIYLPGDRDPAATTVTDFSGGHFDQLRFAVRRATSLGYQVQGGYAVCTVWEGGVSIQARFWIGAENPDLETLTEDLIWVREVAAVPLDEVGPVAFSEGMRMAALVYAGRKVDEGEDA